MTQRHTCGGVLKNLYVRESDFLSRSWRNVGRICMGCGWKVLDLRPKQPMPGTFSLTDVARITGRSRNTVKMHAARGKLETVRDGYSVRVTVRALNQYRDETNGSWSVAMEAGDEGPMEDPDGEPRGD